MKRTLFFIKTIHIVFLLCFAFAGKAQTILHGFVRDSVSKEALIGASLALKNSEGKIIGTQTNSEGFLV
jgi:hypothetical protein